MAKNKRNMKILVVVALIIAAIFIVPGLIPDKEERMIQLLVYDANGDVINLIDLHNNRKAIVDDLANQGWVEMIITVTNNGDVPLFNNIGDIVISGPKALLDKYASNSGALRCGTVTDLNVEVDEFDATINCGDGTNLNADNPLTTEINEAESLIQSTGVNFPDAEPPIFNAVPVSDIGVGKWNITATAKGKFTNEFGETILTEVSTDSVVLKIERDIISPTISISIEK